MVIKEGRFWLDDGVMHSADLKELPERNWWSLMVPPVKPSSALILGVCANTTGRLMERRYGPIRCTKVDVAELAGCHVDFLMSAERFACECNDQFDWAIVDLFNGATVPSFVFGREFAADLARICSNAMVNVPLDREDMPHWLTRWNKVAASHFEGNALIQYARI